MGGTKNSILLVDDEPDILEVLSYYFSKHGFHVITALNGKSGYEEAIEYTPDIIILDLMMPEMDGLTLCKKLRQEKSLDDSQIFILSAKSEEDSEIKAIKAGANDFIAKPIVPKILLSRIQSEIKSSNTSRNTEKVQQFGPLVLNHNERMIHVNGTDEKLSKKEYAVLNLLIKKPGRLYSRDEILAKIYNSNSAKSDRKLDILMRKLVKKTGKKYVKTIKGIGYKFEF